MYLTHNESNSVVAERFIRTLEGNIYEKMTTNNRKCYLRYLNKLVDECNMYVWTVTKRQYAGF